MAQLVWEALKGIRLAAHGACARGSSTREGASDAIAAATFSV
jgi:hypothetical protein